MKTRLLFALALMAIVALASMNVQSFIPDDADGDGVPDSVDVCPVEDASNFDRDGDGCLDPDHGARHIEYWGVDDATITYVINATGSPDVGNGSDFAAVQAAFAAWPAVAGTGLNVVYGGTTPVEDADALDQVNMVTFVDDTYPFSSVVLAVGLSTSFTSDSLYNGRLYRAGEIVDTDMIFNPGKSFKTSTSGPAFGVDIQGVATHEAGHMWGLSHSAIRSATMSYVLPAGLAARTLESDDRLTYFKAYATSSARANANRIAGTVTDGQTSDPVPGAIVFAINAATGDTTACEYTLPDGSYSFVGMPDGNYYISIYPLNGTSPISFIQPGNINALVEATAVAVLVPEYWDAAESNMDDSSAKTAISVGGGSTATADLVTNIDATAPVVVSATPANNSTGVAIDGAFVIRFSEAINTATLAAGFDFNRIPDGLGIGGSLAVLKDDSVIAFTPSTPLEFDTQYRLTLGTGLADQFGNGLTSEYFLDVTTETEPPLSISSLSPNKGVVNTTVVINGRGFDVSPPAEVMFDTTPATVTQVFRNKLVVTVPAGAGTGPVTVTNPSDLSVSNALTFTLLSNVEIARGYETGVVTLASAPTSMALVPDDSYAYIGTGNGADAVVVDPALAGYLTRTGIPYLGGFDGMATTPEGRRVYAVSKAKEELVEIMSDPSTGLLFNTVLSSHDLRAVPQGIVIGSTGQRAYIATADAEIQVWDTQLGSVNYQQQISVMYSPDGASLRGQMAITPDGDFLLALTDAGKLLIYHLGPDSLLQTVNVGLDPRDVIVDAIGDRAYVGHVGGDVSVVALRFLASPSFEVANIVAGGLIRGMDITPAGSYIYATDRLLSQGKIIDLQEGNPTFRTVVADFPLLYKPIAMELTSDGVYGFSLLQGNTTTSPRMIVTTIGLGPTLRNVYPRAARPGDVVVLSGNELGDVYNFISVDFNGVTASPTDIYSGEKLIVKVPAGATTGPVKVTKVSDIPPHEAQTSNEFFFTVLDATPAGGLRFAGNVALRAGISAEATVVVSPRGDLAFVGGSDGEVSMFSIDPFSPDFHQLLGTVDALDPGSVADMAITPDGRYLFVASLTSTSIPIVSALRSASDFGKLVGSLELDIGSNPERIVVSPDGLFTLVYDAGFGIRYADNQYDAQAGTISPVLIGDALAPDLIDMVVHPSGQRAYLAIAFPPAIQVLSLETRGPDFGLIIDTEPMPTPFALPQFQPYGLGITPDGTTLIVNAINEVAGQEVIEFNTPVPGNALPGDTISVKNEWLLGGISGVPFQYHPLAVSPRGDRAIWSRYNFGMSYYTVGDDPAIIVSQGGFDESQQPYDFSFTPDGTRVYMASEAFDSLRVYDFVEAQTIGKVSGDNQSGVAGQTLAAPIRVKVSTTAGGSLAGIALEFSTPNGGFVSTSGIQSSIVLATDSQGYAQATWLLDAATGAKAATVTAPGLVGSPLAFSATAVTDPATLPLQLSQVIPINNSGNQSVTTAVQATFSRGVDRASVTSSTLWMRKAGGGGGPVATAVGYTDSDRKVSLTPILPLDYGAAYEVIFDAALQDTSGGFLTNPTATKFATRAPSPASITAVNPPSGLKGIYVTISGSGFDAVPGNNQVNFAGAGPATPVAGSVDYLKVKVPQAAITGNVTVTTPVATSNGKPFTVLVPNNSPIDDVLATIGVGGGTKSLAVTPDGAVAYTVSTDGDVVIPIAVDSLESLPSIPVGDQPVAIVIHPEGTFAYVVNFGSGSLSILDITPASPDYNTVVQTIIVGSNPIDVVSTDDRVVVANAGSSNLSVIDGDSSSATHHSVLATIGVGGGAKSLAVSPDGARWYIGGDTGYIVMEANSYAVLATIGVGGGAKSLAVTPDGTLLYVLTGPGDIVVYNVEPGTPGENSVLATIGVGGGAKSLAVSPDGTLLFVVQENSDQIIVFEVAVVGGSSVIDNVSSPGYTLVFTAKDTIPTGSEPSKIAFDPSGSGVAIIAQEGETDVTVLNSSQYPVGPLTADAEVRPNTLNLTSNGKYVSGWVELPLGYAPEEIKLETVLMQDTIPPVPGKSEFQDEDGDGVRELRMKFDRALLQEVLPQGEYVEVTISGMVRDRMFVGVDTIRTIRPTVNKPHGGEHIMPQSAYTVQWTSPSGYNVHHADVHFSSDNGEAWTPIAEGIPDQGYVAWVTPSLISNDCRIMVTLYQNATDVLGIGMSQETFALALPVSVALQSFDIGVEEGSAVMRWKTGVEIGVTGFHLVRSDLRDGQYVRVNEELIPASGSAYGGTYLYRDETVRPNQTYYYKLQELAENGLGMEFGPYEVQFRLVNDLAQNVPNPFNPTTTIKFSIESDQLVRLVIYDVAGRRVRTLVDERQRANIYRVSWDGRNDQGQRVASGVYFYRLNAGKFTKTKKMMLLK